MKKCIVLAVAVLGACLSADSSAFAQGSGAPAAAVAHKVGLIDMAHIFKNYKKFDALREDLKNEIASSDAKAKQMVTQLKALDDQLKQMKQGSPGYVEKEKQLLQVNSDFEAFRKGAQRDFVRKESQIYKTVYLEVSDAVEKYAYHYKLTLVMRFNREELEGADEPQDVLNRMNRQIVYFRPEDDITEPVLTFLNRNYEKVVGAEAPRTAPARTAGGSK